MSALPDDDHTLKEIGTLAILNILQPATKESIMQVLDKTMSSEKMELVLDELIRSGFVTSERGHYRVTRKGISFNVSGKVRILRDVNRMKHLLRTSQQRGGDSFGR